MSDSAEPRRLYEAIGRAIKVERTARGIERKELAERSGISYPYLSEIENGSKRPSSKALIAIAQALGLHPSDLLRMAESWPERLADDEPEPVYSRVSRARLSQEPPPWLTGAVRSPTRGGGRERLVAQIHALLEQLDADDLATVRDLVARLIR